jgi:hypothetical protein
MPATSLGDPEAEAAKIDRSIFELANQMYCLRPSEHAFRNIDHVPVPYIYRPRRLSLQR